MLQQHGHSFHRDSTQPKRNVFAAVLSEHEQLPVMGKEWAYRLGAASDAVQEDERNFIFLVPFSFALKTKYAGLNRGLLKKIEFQQGDSCLSALRMTFNNGSEERQCAFGHW